MWIAASSAWAADLPDSSSYLRVVESAPGQVELQVALRKLEKPGAPAIWLCGVSHIGEPAYYQQLQQHLDHQSIVLYEAVGGLPRLEDDATEDQRRRWTRQALQFVAMAADRYRNDRGNYPPTFGLLVQWARSQNKLMAAWIRQASTDAWGKPIEYRRAEGKLAISASHDQKVTRSGVSHPHHEPAEDWSAQSELARALGLVFQLDAIDYDKPHFRHSDLPIAALSRHVQDRLAKREPQPIEPKTAGAPQARKPVAIAADDSESDDTLDSILQVMRGEGMIGGLLKTVINFMKFSPRFAGLTRAVMVEALGAVQGDMSESAAMPPQMRRMMRTLIQDRNAVVIEYLRKCIESPQPPESLGVFYGAAHMFDFQKTLMRELGYAPGEEIWLTAMRADAADTGLSAEEFRSIRAVIRFQMQQALRPLKEND